METIVVINAHALSDYARQPFMDGSSALDRVLGYATGLTDASAVLVLCNQDESLPEAVGRRLDSEWSLVKVLEACQELAKRFPEADALVYLHGDAPFYDRELAERLLSVHRQYRAEYCFADGYPPGYAPELLRPSILANLSLLAEQHPVDLDRDSLFNLLQKDINSYDIETELAPVDLRAWRFSPLCDSRRNMLAVRRLWEQGLISAAAIVDALPRQNELLRTVPAFLWVQVSAACRQSCSYCPYPAMAGDPRRLDATMAVTDFAALIDQAVNLSDELVVDISLWGDPACHPDFAGLVEAVLRHPRTTLLVETAGIGWDYQQVHALTGRWPGRLHWILSLDSADPDLYQRLRGGPMAEAWELAERLCRDFPAVSHVQAVRMHENEEQLEAFYRGWTKLTDKVIIQKYDSFASSLPARQVADLSPLRRMPCRHLARDMAVLLDGSVPLCKHGLAPHSDHLAYPIVLGNAFTDGLAECWQRMDAYYQRHCRSDYPEICGKCDEYHTFNA